MASRFYVATTKCFKCDKIVYASELIAVLDKVWHRACFKCDKCERLLNIFNMSAFNGKPYCKTCFDDFSASKNNSPLGEENSPLPLLQIEDNNPPPVSPRQENNPPPIPSRQANHPPPVRPRKENLTPSSHGKPINILLFGETGAGKSSVVNMLLDEHVCKTSDDAVGCTTESKPYEKTLIDYGSITLRVYDTAGLGEGDHGSISNKEAFLKLVGTLYKTKEDGIHLLLCCHRSGNKISTESFKQNYDAFINVICEKKVPSILIITHCDQDKTLDTWKNNNQGFVQQHFNEFKTIISVAANKEARHLDENEYHLSRKNAIQAITTYALENSWKMDAVRRNIVTLFKQFCNTMQKRVKFLKTYTLSEDFVKAFVSLGFDKEQAIQEANLLYTLLQASTKTN